MTDDEAALVTARGARADVPRHALMSQESTWTALIWLGIAVLWLRPIGSSLWLDELGTYWVVKGGLWEAIDLAWRYQGQSPAYYLVAWGARVVGGGNEIVLRLPSLGVAALSLLLVDRLGRRLFSPEVGGLSAVLFAITPIVASSAVDARPYAFAYLALIASTLLVVRLTEERGIALALAYGVTAAATVYFHYAFGFALLGHAAFAFVRLRGKGLDRWTPLAVGAVVAGALVLPLVAQLARLADRGRLQDLPLGEASVGSFLIVLAPTSFAVTLLPAWLLARLSGPIELGPVRARPGALTLCAAITFLPPLGLFAFSALTSVNLLWKTYTRSSAVGLALLLGAGFGMLQPKERRRIALAAVVTVSLLVYGGTWRRAEDWRGAATTVSHLVRGPDTPVLLHPAFLESAHLPFLEQPEFRSLLLAPIARYPMEGSIILMPYDLTPAAERYLEERVLPQLTGTDRFVLVTLYPSVPYRAWLAGRLAAQGFRARTIGEHGTLEVILFASRPG